MKKSLVVLALLMTSAAVNAADPFVGTYKLNAAKSKISGAPAVVEGTLIITEDGDNLVLTPSFRNTDSQFLFAAVAETETDIVLFDGLIR